jgi:CubicO group peptidase (beta-lactamase class C family)
MTSPRIKLLAVAAAGVVATGLLHMAPASGQPAAPAAAAAPAAPAPAADKRCTQPSGTAPYQQATPAQVSLDPAAVREALDYATTHQRTSVRIFRHNCQVATSALDPVSEKVPWHLWSGTKSVTSMLTGIAYTQGKLRIDDPIGKYLPAGMGDRAHRALTIRNLLEMNTGLHQALVSEGIPSGTEPNACKTAMALPFDYEPGTRFEYQQYGGPQLMACVLERAVKQDLQAYAQKYLFGPVGIPRDHWFWMRDRAGNTYGYAWLFMRPADLGRLGLLLSNEGTWRGKRIIKADYIRQAGRPTATNGCYGRLFWVNGGKTCTTSSVTARRTLPHSLVPSAPPDLYMLAGALHQNIFVIPSLDLMITWTGVGGDRALDPQAQGSAKPGADLYYNFFRILMKGVKDVDVPDAGPYQPDPAAPVNVDEFFDPLVLLGAYGLGPYAPPGCNVLFCGEDDLLTGPTNLAPDALQAVLGTLLDLGGGRP